MLLALDTSTLWLSLALVARSGRCVEQVAIGPPSRQSDVLPSAIAELLSRHGLDVAALDGFVCGLGPGSFTGLRIGLSTLKGLAYAVEKPLVGASSLMAIALEAPEGGELFTSAVVKKGELYLGRFLRRGDQVEALAPETSLTVQAFAQALIASPNARAVGPALSDYRAALVQLGVPPAQLLDGPSIPSAVSVARLALWAGWPVGYRKEDVFALEPHYLRGSGAEENPKFPPLPGVDPKARLKVD